MTMLITNSAFPSVGRQVMYVGGLRVDMFQAEHNTGASARDDARGRFAFARAGWTVTPICTTTGAGDIAVTWTNAVTRGSACLVSISNSTITENGLFMGWGW